MKFKICALFLIFGMGIQAAWPQSVPVADANARLDAQWRRLQTLGRGEQVRIQRLNKKTVEGSVETVTDDSLTATTKDGAVTIPRSDIHEVKVRNASQQRQNAFLGAFIGGVSGVATAAILDGALTDGNGMSSSAAAFFGAVGAGAGFAIRSLRPAYRTIYKT